MTIDELNKELQVIADDLRYEQDQQWRQNRTKTNIDNNYRRHQREVLDISESYAD